MRIAIAMTNMTVAAVGVRPEERRATLLRAGAGAGAINPCRHMR